LLFQQPFDGPGRELILHQESYRADREAVAGMHNGRPGNQLAVDERAINGRQVLHGQVVVAKDQSAMTSTDCLRRNPQLAAAAPPDDGLRATELESLSFTPFCLQDQFDFHFQSVTLPRRSTLRITSCGGRTTANGFSP